MSAILEVPAIVLEFCVSAVFEALGHTLYFGGFVLPWRPYEAALYGFDEHFQH